ncbi:hypothetical protein FOCC_FOCC011001 [Frankliniella occidentalis]|nr:hypothetical protein FOCC_FOCC011001 [Frankliniella occidentalis]
MTAALQGVDLDLMGASNHVNAVLSKLSSMRSDEGFQAYGERADDEPIADPTLKLKVEMYFLCLDTIHTLISDRFSETSQGIFRDLSLCSVKRILEIKKEGNGRSTLTLPNDAFSVFCSTYGKFVNVASLRKEYLQFVECFESYNSAAQKLPEMLHPQPVPENQIDDLDDDEWVDVEITDTDLPGPDLEFDLLQNDSDVTPSKTQNRGSIRDLFKLFFLTGLKEVFPTLEVALRIALTLPVSSASTERSFSKLKLVKVKTRCTTGQGR